MAAHRLVSRRAVLTLMVGGGAATLLAACGQQQPAAPAKPAETKPAAPAAAATSAPAADAKPAGQAAPAVGKDSFDWKKFNGETIRVMVNKNGVGDMFESKNPAFTELTGIKVNFEILPEDQFRQKSVVELASGSGSIDVFMTLLGQEGLKFLKAGWYAPVKGFIDNPALTSPDWDFSDFTEAAIKAQTVSGAGIEPTLVGVPISLDSQTLAVNKDLLAAKNLPVPTTFDELEQAAQALTNKGQNVFGISSRGKRAAAVSMFCTYLHGLGGTWLDDKGEPALNSPEAVGAFEYYGRLLRESGPPGSSNYHFYEVNDIFMQERAAMVTDAIAFRSFYEDKEKSKVAGKVGYNPIMKGPAGQFPIVYGWGFAVANQSKKQEAAWYYAQWMTNKENSLEHHIKYGQASGRTSVWNSERAQREAPFPKDWSDTFAYHQRIGFPQWVPPVIPVSEVRDVIGDVIVTAIEGGEVKPAADKMVEQFRDIVKRAG